MKRSLPILLFVFLMLVVYNVSAQKEKKAGEAELKPAAKAKPVYSYLGRSELKGGTVSKREFDSLLKQGIHSKDDMGQHYRIEGFTFTYAERNVYEDSVGNLKIMADYLSEPCFGDTLTRDISNSIYDRTKAGDTAYFDNIKVLRPDNTEALSKSMKFAIGK